MKQPAGDWHPPEEDATVSSASDDASLPDEFDIELAKRAVRVHCPMQWPEGLQCNNCRAPFPCVTHSWGYELLEQAGWSEAQIIALDQRVGPWF